MLRGAKRARFQRRFQYGALRAEKEKRPDQERPAASGSGVDHRGLQGPSPRSVHPVGERGEEMVTAAALPPGYTPLSLRERGSQHTGQRDRE